MINIDFSKLGEMLNDWVKNIFYNRSRFVVCKGGGGSGKSFGIAQILVYRMIAEEGHKMLVIRKVDNTLRDSCFALIKEVIYLYNCQDLFTINKSEMTITNKYNGNMMLFKGLQDPERIKSINGITDIWIEEATELEVADYRQLNIRLRTRSKNPLQMFITFNPVSITHWLKAEFWDNRKSNAITIETTYKDNKFLVQEARDVLESFKDTDPYYYSVYALGEWGVTGQTVFPAQLVQERLVELKETYKTRKIKRGSFVYEKTAIIDESGQPVVRIDDNSIKFIEEEEGFITIYSNTLPYIPYTIGVDTSEGVGGDAHCANCINNITGEQVAMLHSSTLDEDCLAEQLYCFGKLYNEALISVEVNYSTHPQKCLEKLNYPKLYLREAVDNIGVNLADKFGWKTTSSTRPIIIAEMIAFVRENINKINDIGLLEEMLTFIRNKNGRPEADVGAHDDRILATAISLCQSVRNQQSYLPLLEEKVKSIRDRLPEALITEEELQYEEGDDTFW